MTTLTLLSALVLFGFIAICVNKHGLLPSYFAYASRWWVQGVQNMNIWQIVTFLAAMLLMPPMIEAGTDNALQCLGFATPAYLIAVGCTPDWETSKKEHIFHTAFAVICAVCAFLWMALVAKVWYIILPVAAFVAVLGFATKTLKPSLTFWGEMVMFGATYVTLILHF